MNMTWFRSSRESCSLDGEQISKIYKQNFPDIQLLIGGSLHVCTSCLSILPKYEENDIQNVKDGQMFCRLMSL